METLNVAEALIRCLKNEDVELVFGYPGGYIVPIYDAFYDADIKHVLVRHEQGAVHAADGYARATGKVGVCMATSGPGATNLVTGIANAYMDSVPMVVITGQVPTSMVGTDAFQEVDITGITIPITKHNYLVKDARLVPQVIKKAFHIARTGRPGPVLIDLPKDIMETMIDFKYPDKVTLHGYEPNPAIDEELINRAVEMINKSEKPVIYAGGGIKNSGAAKELKALAESINAPVTTTLMGLGGFPENHSLSMGISGLHGTRYANLAFSQCDLVIALGVRFGDRGAGEFSEFASQANIIHVDIDPAEISKNVQIDFSITGDLKKVLNHLIPLVKPKNTDSWLEEINSWKKLYPLHYEVDGQLKAQYIIEQIRDLTKGEAIIVTDVGQHQMWTAQYGKHIKPGNFITSGGLGTMGYGFPAAIGAQMGVPGKQVFLITGDGSFQMNMQEFATAVEQELPIKIIIMNNKRLGMVRQIQQLYCDSRYSSVDFKVSPDFVKFAEVYGASGYRVESPEELSEALSKLIAENKPAILDCFINPDENVYPMAMAGKPMHQPLDNN